jgi:two-component system, cell cycle response regulator
MLRDVQRIRRAMPGVAAAAAAGLALHVVLLALGRGEDPAGAVLYQLLMLGGAAAILLRAAVVADDRAAWVVLGLGVAAWAAGDLWFTLAGAGGGGPALGDALLLAFYPAASVGLALLLRVHARAFSASLWLDALIAGLAVGALAAAVLSDVAADLGGDATTVLVALAYPAGDVVLLALVGALLALTAWRPGPTWLLLGGALALSAGGDAAYVLRSAAGTYAPGTVLDAVWPASVLLLALAAWWPGRGAVPRPEGLRILAMPAGFALLAMALLVVAQVTPLSPVALALACGTIVALVLRLAVTLQENLRMVAASRGEALTDALTGLGNRRRLIGDLGAALETAGPGDPWLLILFDLDGFKGYNDGYGHLAGDALLARLGAKLRAAVAAHGHAYRLGGDEFCALGRLAPGAPLEELLERASAALSDAGDGWQVGCSYGAVILPQEAATPSLALQLADQRMYARKEGRSSATRLQAREVLVRALHAREPGLEARAARLARLAHGVGRRLGLEGEALDEVARAAELHDVGKVAVPDAILGKDGALTDEEWAFVRRHTILGERILNGAAAMRPVARLVRSSHERFDGRGYPDGLAGEAIPLGARIVAVCDAYEAMTSERPYRPTLTRDAAVAELRREAGRQFDPAVVEAFVAELAGAAAPDGPGAGDDARRYAREVAEQLRDAIGPRG